MQEIVSQSTVLYKVENVNIEYDFRSRLTWIIASKLLEVKKDCTVQPVFIVLL